MPHFECGAFNRSATSPKPKTGPKGPNWTRYVTKRDKTNKGGRGVYIDRGSKTSAGGTGCPKH